MISTTLPFHHNDGGFQASGISDTNNCTVVAFAIVTGLDYDVCDVIAMRTKRKRRGGHWPEKMVNYGKRVFGLKFKKFKFSSITVQKFIKKHPVGKYYVYNRDHCFAIIDGVIHDRSSSLVKPFQIIKGAWLVL